MKELYQIIIINSIFLVIFAILTYFYIHADYSYTWIYLLGMAASYVAVYSSYYYIRKKQTKPNQV